MERSGDAGDDWAANDGHHERHHDDRRDATDFADMNVASDASAVVAATAPVPMTNVAAPAPGHRGLRGRLHGRLPGRGRGSLRLAGLGRHGLARWNAASGNLRGSVLSLVAIVLFSVMLTTIKEIGTGLPLTETLLIRQVMVTILLLPLFTPDILGALRTKHLGLQLSRGLLSLGSQLSYFMALLYLPFAEMTALCFSQVLFMTVLAVIVLKEKVGWRRWGATLVGFVGVLIMLKPSGGGFNGYALLAVLSALLVCGVTITIRMMARTENTATIMLYQSIVLCTAYIGPALYWWVWPTPRQWVLLVITGVVGTAAQYIFTLACRIGEASALAPMEYTRLIFAIAIGYFLFAEVPDLATMVGAGIVIAATIYTMRRNAETSPGGTAQG
ncbi:DMT family transporter [Methylobrevis albus]|uniref:DMT family transporter n=1 Tax=Methylobrevis albus TaxID=2793297 RepID=A0A931MZE9_9HYPH|nr:DMT family transporter [Methylobrevis albus]MBH0237984.1 DMT family transporter [Methylobrevis albus]